MGLAGSTIYHRIGENSVARDQDNGTDHISTLSDHSFA